MALNLFATIACQIVLAFSTLIEFVVTIKVLIIPRLNSQGTISEATAMYNPPLVTSIHPSIHLVNEGLLICVTHKEMRGY